MTKCFKLITIYVLQYTMSVIIYLTYEYHKQFDAYVYFKLIIMFLYIFCVAFNSFDSFFLFTVNQLKTESDSAIKNNHYTLYETSVMQFIMHKARSLIYVRIQVKQHYKDKILGFGLQNCFYFLNRYQKYKR